MRPGAAISAVVLAVLAVWQADSQPATRRVTTVAALHQYPGYFHLQNVLVHGELAENGARMVLRGGEREIPVLLNDIGSPAGLVEVRGQLFDVGRFEPGDPRVASFDGARDPDRWPRPGEELVLNVTSVSAAQLATSPSVRALALQPWRFDGQKVTVVGQFRGRNLFGDLPNAPGKSRYDFVLRSADAAIWVTELRPRGRGFDLSVDARVDTGRWLQVTGTVAQERGLVTMAGTAIAEATAPEVRTTEEDSSPPPVPLEPGEVIFSSPTEGEVGVPIDASVRLQFSRGLNPASLAGQIRVSYTGGPPVGDATPAPEFGQNYDPGTRAVEIHFTRPLERFRTVKIEVLDGIKTFDGAPVRPWAIMFSVGN